MRIRLEHLLYGIGAAIAFTFVVIWSGLFNVGASTGHWPITQWFLHTAMRQSVTFQSFGIETPPLNDPAMVRRGAGHYELACAGCHGSPLRPRDTIVLSMTPTPPTLAAQIDDWTPAQLFWIVKHGIKLTAMPAWPSQVRDDEVWSIVAFMLELPAMPPETYRELALGRTAGGPEREPLAAPGPAATCVRCHGPDGAGSPDGAFPRLDIQTAEYLYLSLFAFREGRRQSGIMANAVSGLSDAELQTLAGTFAGGGAGAAYNATDNPLAEQLATRGIPERNIGACDGCHSIEGDAARPEFPRLAGQYESYLVTQLRLFALPDNPRGGGPFSELMHEASHMLTEDEIAAVARWYGR